MNTPLEHILLVDDDPDIRLIARLALRRGGWRVDVAGSGDEALAAVAEARPDLVLMDVMLEGTTGPELMEKLPPSLPVVFLTARKDVERNGAVGIIHKPFDPGALVDQIEGMWRSARPAAGAV